MWQLKQVGVSRVWHALQSTAPCAPYGSRSASRPCGSAAPHVHGALLPGAVVGRAVAVDVAAGVQSMHPMPRRTCTSVSLGLGAPLAGLHGLPLRAWAVENAACVGLDFVAGVATVHVTDDFVQPSRSAGSP